MLIPKEGKPFSITIGEKTQKELFEALEKKHINLSDYIETFIKSSHFLTSKKPETIQLVRLNAYKSFALKEATVMELYKKAEEFGYDFCPAEVGPYLRSTYNQSNKDHIHIFMNEPYVIFKPNSKSVPSEEISLFLLEQDPSTGLWLTEDHFIPEEKLNLERMDLIFRLN